MGNKGLLGSEDKKQHLPKWATTPLGYGTNKKQQEKQGEKSREEQERTTRARAPSEPSSASLGVRSSEVPRRNRRTTVVEESSLLAGLDLPVVAREFSRSLESWVNKQWSDGEHVLF